MYNIAMSKSKFRKKDIPDIEILSNAPLDSDQAISDFKFVIGALIKALKDRKNKIIGVIGDFGSGKSSAIASYKRINKKFHGKNRRKIIEVSLADFCSNNDVNDKDLQFSIVQQLFHSVYRHKIPSSGFVKKGIKYRTILFFSFFTLCIASLILGFTSKNISFLCGYSWIPFSVSAIFGILALPFLFTVFSLKRITAKINNIEIELEKSTGSNLFDYFLDEILYFFIKSKTDLVIFEDIDRSPDCEKLFTKLYTLNTCINNFPKFKNSKKSIVFLHAVRETIFPEGEEKSKYFDVLLPVRPVYSFESSKDHIKKELKNVNLEKVLPDYFLDLLANEITYFRQLNNVINSFNVMYRTIGSLNEEDACSLMCLMLYKSSFPFDYILSIKNKGFLRYLVAKEEKRKKGEDFVNFEGSEYDIKIKDQKTVEQFFYTCKECDAVTELKRVKGNGEKKELNITKETQEKIKKFFTPLKAYIDKDSFDLISIYPEETDSSIRIFLKKVSSRKESNYIDYHLQNIDQVVRNGILIENIDAPAVLNIDLVRYMFAVKSDLFKKFADSFKIKSELRDLFLLRLFDLQKIDYDITYLKILSALSENYLFDHKNLREYYGDQYFKLLTKEIIISKKAYEKQNSGGLIKQYLLNIENFDELFKLPTEIFGLLLDNKYKFKNIGNVSLVNDDNKIKFKSLLENECFEVTQNNVKSLCELLSNEDINFLSILHQYNVLNYVLEGLTTNKISIDIFCNDYSKLNEELVKTLLSSNVYDFTFSKTFFNTIPVINIKNNVISPKYIPYLISENKISGTIDDFAFLMNSIPNNNYVEYIFKNLNLLNEAAPTSDIGINFLYSLFNSVLCNENNYNILMGKIMGFKVQYTKFKNSSYSFKRALSEHRYLLNSDLFNLMANDVDLLTALITNKEYLEDLANSMFTYEVTFSQLEFLLNNVADDDFACLIADRFTNAVSANINSYVSFKNRLSLSLLRKEIVLSLLSTCTDFDDETLNFVNKTIKKIDNSEIETFIYRILTMKNLTRISLPINDITNAFYKNFNSGKLIKKTKGNSIFFTKLK